MSRADDSLRGREFYEEAASHRYTRRERKVRILAKWRLALEEARAGTDQADTAVVRAECTSKGSKRAEVVALKKRLEQMKSEDPGRARETLGIETGGTDSS